MHTAHVRVRIAEGQRADLILNLDSHISRMARLDLT
jgi:hypothetical protein